MNDEYMHPQEAVSDAPDYIKKTYLEPLWEKVLLAEEEERTIEPRTHIYASEIGKSFYDRYQKMMGVEPTNPLEARVLGKFAMGRAIERVIGEMLAKGGYIKEKEEHVEIPENDKHLKVSGRIDYVLTEEGAIDTPLELKSINSMVFWAKKDYLMEAYPFHIMQLYTYLKAKGIKSGIIGYVSKDDGCIKEFSIEASEELDTLWTNDVEKMSTFIRDKVEPPVPEFVVLNSQKGISFQKNKKKYKTEGIWEPNWEVGWSQYFSKITGFDLLEEWQFSLRDEIREKNEELKKQFIEEHIS